MQKLFKPVSVFPEEIYQELLIEKNKSAKDSNKRFTFFDNVDFSFYPVDPTRDSTIAFHDDLVSICDFLHSNSLKYRDWCENHKYFQPLLSPQEIYTRKTINEHTLDLILNNLDVTSKDLESFSIGTFLFTFCLDIIRNYRDFQITLDKNKISFNREEIEDIFSNLEKDLLIEHSKENTTQSHLIAETINESDSKIFEMNTKNENNTPFIILINEGDNILKKSIENKLDKFDIAIKEKVLYFFRKFPGMHGHLSPFLNDYQIKEQRAHKREIYPFLEVPIPLYEKFEVIKSFEGAFKNKVPEQTFNFGDRKYHELMDRDLLLQNLNSVSLFDTETLYLYNKRDNNFLFASYYRCPKGRIFRKYYNYRYLSKFSFENWVRIYQNSTVPKLTEKMSQAQIDSESMKKNVNPKDKSKKEPLKKDIKKDVPKDKVVDSPKETINTLKDGINIETVSPLSSPRDTKNSKFMKTTDELLKEQGDLIKLRTSTLYDADDLSTGEISERIKFMFPSDNGVIVKKVIQNGVYTSNSNYILKNNLIFGIREHRKQAEFWTRFENDVLLTVNYHGTYEEGECIYDNENGATFTFTMANGLQVQVMQNGDIVQKQNSLIEDRNFESELSRIISSKAAVIQNFRMGDSKIIYPNGNVATIQNGMLTK